MSRVAWLLAATLVLFTGSANAQQKVQLIANTSPPYADARLPEQGLALELVNHVFAGTDYAPVITIEGWSRAIEGARIGVYDGLASVWFTDDRNEDLLFSKPYVSSKLILLKQRTNTRNYSSLQQLSGGRLGVRTDYAYGVDFASIPGLTLVEENHLIQNLLKLRSGAIDFVIGDQRTINMQLHEYMAGDIAKFSVMNIDLPQRERHVAVSRANKGHEKIIAEFDRSLATARSNGSLQAIIKKWDDKYEGVK